MTSASWRADWVAYAAVSLVAALLFLPTNADPDLWGHLRYGLDILEQHSVDTKETYAFTADKPFVYHEWLGGVSMALAYRLAGISGLVLLKLAILTASLVTLARILRAAPLQFQVAALLTVCWSLLPITLTVRPQLWSVSGVALVLALLERERGIWWMPIVFAIWPTLHGGWIVGAGLLGIWAAYKVAVERQFAAVAVVVVAALASLLNPYGVTLWRFLGETVRLERSDIQDWRPLWTTPVPVWGPWIFAAAAAVLVGVRSRPRADRLLSIALFAYASLLVVRLVPFFVIITAVYLTPSLRSMRSWHVTTPLRAAARLLWVPISIVAGTIVFATPHPLRTGCLRIDGEWAPDLTVGAALQKARPVGRLAVPFNWGQYAIWHVGPALRVSMDGRRETIYSDRTVKLQYEVVKDSAAGREWVLRTMPELIWMPPEADRQEWLRAHGYRIDIATPRSVLAVRRDQPPVAASLPHPPCFPG